jgi:hypothetical protein
MDQVLGSSSRDVLDPPIPGGRGITTLQRHNTDHSASIPGWGSDLELAKRPGVPRDKAPALGSEHLYPPIPAMAPPHLIHKSTEHGQMPPVFGTSCPPRGLSGLLRSFAYRFSEGRLARWMTLMFADRVDVVEGIVEDLAHLRVPNVGKEMGLASELRYNREAFVRKAAIAAGIAAAVGVYWAVSRSRR